MRSQRRSSWSLLPLYYLLAVQLGGCYILVAEAKKVSGDFQLSGVNTEIVLASFALLPSGGRFEATLIAAHMYENERSLMVRAYRDTEWRKFLKEPLCTGKTKLAKETRSVTFRQINGKWQADIDMQLGDLERTPTDDPMERKLQKNARNHYWYFVIDDCSLEEYFHDNKVPKIHYDLYVRNYRGKRTRMTQLSADEIPLPLWHALTMMISILVCWS
jgi:hypothetical protein